MYGLFVTIHSREKYSLSVPIFYTIVSFSCSRYPKEERLDIRDSRVISLLESRTYSFQRKSVLHKMTNGDILFFRTQSTILRKSGESSTSQFYVVGNYVMYGLGLKYFQYFLK